MVLVLINLNKWSTIDYSYDRERFSENLHIKDMSPVYRTPSTGLDAPSMLLLHLGRLR